jgi:hypothetical protein
MALWGNNDNVTTASAGIVTVSGTTVTGTATTFTNYTAGQTLTIGKGSGTVAGTGGTAGFAVIKSIASNTSMTLVDTDALYTTGAVTGLGTDGFIVGSRPKYLDEDPNFAPTSANGQRSYTSHVYGVDATMQKSRVTTGSKYKAPHAGWVGVTTYVDCHGNLRVKSETFVAMSGISTHTQIQTFVLPA